MKKKVTFCRKLCGVLLCLAMLAGSMVPAFATKAAQTVRVAFYPLEGFFEYDADGDETGYGVELLDKISQYTGIRFTYVPAESWESTKYMLLEGEADLRMPATMPRTPSTTLGYGGTSLLDTFDVLLTLDTRDDLYYQDYETMRTLRIAVSQSFYEANDTQSYLDQYGITADQLVLCEEYSDSRDLLYAGEVDAIISNIMDMESGMKMLTRFNNTSNYFTMVLGKPMLELLDDAMQEIKLDEPLYLPRLYAKWFPDRTTVPLTQEESRYLAEVDTLTFAFRTDEGYLSRCEDGEYYGIYVETAKRICEKLGVGFDAVSIPDALAGEVTANAYAGFFYDRNYAEEWGFNLSSPIDDINYYIIQKKETAFDPATCRIAVMEEFHYTEDYLKKQYPNATFIPCETYEQCLQAVANGRAEMTVINNYIAEYYLGMYQFGDLTVRLSTEYSHLYCFATPEEDTLLPGILTKAISMITDEEMNQTYIVGQESRPDSNFLQAFLYRNPAQFVLLAAGVCTLVVVIILLLLFARKSREQNSKLQTALAAKSDFLARMSHDMRTPMNGILGLSYLMEKGDDPEEIREYIPQLRESGEYLLQLINDVLDVSKIESGSLMLSPRVCNEEQLFNSVIEMMTPQINEKKLDFHFEKINIEWQYMLLDEQRVKQIFVNLLSNAIKFTPVGGRIDFIMELVSQTEDVIRDKFVVRDTGIGISEEFLPHIFEPFRQENRGIPENAQGTGLGLPIVKQLVELMGGSVSVKTKLNEGTEFTVYINFPLAQRPGEETAPDTEAVLPEGLHILLCEDHPLNARIARKLLEDRGAVVTWAENGKLGVAEYEKSAPGYYDAVLMDIRMPEMDGLEAARTIRAMTRSDAAEVPIIAVTANAYDEDRKKAKAAGMNCHLAKPIDPERLYRTLEQCLKKDTAAAQNG